MAPQPLDVRQPGMWEGTSVSNLGRQAGASGSCPGPAQCGIQMCFSTTPLQHTGPHGDQAHPATHVQPSWLSLPASDLYRHRGPTPWAAIMAVHDAHAHEVCRLMHSILAIPSWSKACSTTSSVHPYVQQHRRVRPRYPSWHAPERFWAATTTTVSQFLDRAPGSAAWCPACSACIRPAAPDWLTSGWCTDHPSIHPSIHQLFIRPCRSAPTATPTAPCTTRRPACRTAGPASHRS